MTFVVMLVLAAVTRADQASDTTINIVGQTAGPTPFIARVQLTTDNISAISSIQFSVAPKPGSLTRPISATYTSNYLEQHGNLSRGTGQITVPVFGLYDGFANDVTLNYLFGDASSRQEQTKITTESFNAGCYQPSDILLPRQRNAPLSYDFMLVKGACSDFSPVVLDTDGAVRWVGTAHGIGFPGLFYDNAIYMGDGPRLIRMELDGSFAIVADYSSSGVVDLHHNMDRGKSGMLIELDTQDQVESEIAEVASDGRILKTWKLAQIIRDAMVADNENPDAFVRPPPEDWFHNNANTYRKSDDSLIVSSRENFVIALDYASGAIKWILGDSTKQWYQFASLRKYALALGPNTTPPIGQHAVSITAEDDLMLFDNGTASGTHTPPGESRSYSAARQYHLDNTARTATEVWNYENGQSLYSSYCSSVYRDSGLSYLVDYSYLVNVGPDTYAQLVGLTASGQQAFSYRYLTLGCDSAFNAMPLHWEQLYFSGASAVGTQPRVSLANVSTRGLVRSDEDVMIAGFIISGTRPKSIVIRALGPTLAQSGIQRTLADPVLELHDAQGLVAQDDDYVPSADLTASGFQPSDPRESVIMMSLVPGAYTAILSSKNGQEGVGLVEVYDLGFSATGR